MKSLFLFNVLSSSVLLADASSLFGSRRPPVDQGVREPLLPKVQADGDRFNLRIGETSKNRDGTVFYHFQHTNDDGEVLERHWRYSKLYKWAEGGKDAEKQAQRNWNNFPGTLARNRQTRLSDWINGIQSAAVKEELFYEGLTHHIKHFTVLFIRHGRTVNNDAGSKFWKHVSEPVDVTHQGRVALGNQVATVQRYIREATGDDRDYFDVAFTSPQVRTIQTADAMRDTLPTYDGNDDPTVTVLPRLKEVKSKFKPERGNYPFRRWLCQSGADRLRQATFELPLHVDLDTQARATWSDGFAYGWGFEKVKESMADALIHDNVHDHLPNGGVLGVFGHSRDFKKWFEVLNRHNRKIENGGVLVGAASIEWDEDQEGNRFKKGM